MDIFRTMLSWISGSSDVAREAELRRTAFACGRGRLHHWKPSSKPIMHYTVSHTFLNYHTQSAISQERISTVTVSLHLVYLFSAETNTYTTSQRNWTQRSRLESVRAKFPPAPHQVPMHCYIIGKFNNCNCATSAAISCFLSRSVLGPS